MAIERGALNTGTNSSDSSSVSTNTSPTDSKLEDEETYSRHTLDLELGLNMDPFTTHSTLPFSIDSDGTKTLRASSRGPRSDSRLGKLRSRLRTPSLRPGAFGSETAALARARSSFTNLLDAQRTSLDGGLPDRHAPRGATASHLRPAGLGYGYESDSGGVAGKFSPSSSRPSLGGIEEYFGGTPGARRTFDVSTPARVVVHTHSRISYEMGEGSVEEKALPVCPAGVDVDKTPVGKRSLDRIWGMRLKVGLPAKDKLSSGISTVLYAPRPRLSLIRGLVGAVEPGGREEAGVGVCGKVESETLGPCVGGGNESGSRVTGSSRALASSSSEREQQSSMLSRSGSESAVRRAGPPRPPPSRPPPATPIEFALPGEENGRQREHTVRQLQHAGSSSSGPSPRSSAAFPPSGASSLSSVQRPNSGVDHARYSRGPANKNGTGHHVGDNELLSPYESTGHYGGPYRDSIATDDSGSLPPDEEDHAQSFEFTADCPPGTATTVDDARIASHRPHTSISSRTPIAESNVRWSAARSRSGSTASVGGWRGVAVNTAPPIPDDQDDYGLPSPELSPPDPDGLMSHGEYGGIVGPRRDLYSDDELESVAEENETESIVSEDDLAAVDREDRTAAMIIADEGRGLIVDANGRPVPDLEVQQGTTHLLLPHSATPTLLPAFLATVLPQISTTLLCLDLAANNLPALPPALSACTHLEELNVSSNPLRSLPPSLGALASLRVLIADGCELTSLPAQLTHLGALHSLSVRGNRLVMLPVWMCSMPSLEVLKIEGNAFSGPWRGVVEPLLPRNLTPPSSGAGSLMPGTPASAMGPPSAIGMSPAASPGGQYLVAPPLSAAWPASATSVNTSLESASSGAGDRAMMPGRGLNGNMLSVNGGNGISGGNAVYAATRAANSYPMLATTGGQLSSPIAMAPGGGLPSPPRAQVQRSYSQQPHGSGSGGYSPYLGSRPATATAQSPPPPQTTAAALNMHLGALAPASSGRKKKKKRRGGGSVSGGEGHTTDAESEVEGRGGASGGSFGGRSTSQSREEHEQYAEGGWTGRPGPRRMKSADELRRMGQLGPGMGLGLAGPGFEEGMQDPQMPGIGPHGELTAYGAHDSEAPGSQMKRYVSLGVRSSPSKPDARSMWANGPGAGTGPRGAGVGVGQRNSASAATYSQRHSAAGGGGQRSSAVGVGLQGQTVDEDEDSPDVSFEESKSPYEGHEDAYAGTKGVSSSPEEQRRKGRWGFLKKVSMGRLRSHSNAERLGRPLPPARVGDMPGMPVWKGPGRGESPLSYGNGMVSPPQSTYGPMSPPQGTQGLMSPPQPIAMAMAAPPRVDVTSAGSPASSVLTARVLQHKQSRENLGSNGSGSGTPNGVSGGLFPPLTAPRAKRRSFLPVDVPPTLNIPIPSAEPFMPSVIALGGGEGEDGESAESSAEAQRIAAEEAQRRADEEAARSRVALRSVMNYLRDMADLGAAGEGGNGAMAGVMPSPRNARRPPLTTYADGRTMSDGSFASSSASTPPMLRSAPSTASLRGGQDSVVTTDSSGSYGQGFSEDRKYKDDKGKRAGIVKEIIDTEKSYVKGLQELVDIYVKPASEPAPGLNVGKETTIPAQERKIVFTGVDALLQFHKQSFLPSLISAAAGLQSGAEDTNGQLSTMAAHAVANVFMSHAAFMKMYFTYINNFDNAIQRLQYWSAPPSTPNTPGNATPATPATSTVSMGITMVAMGVTGMTPEQPQHTATLNAGQRKRIKTFLKRCRIHPRHSQLNLEGYLLLPIQRIPRYKMLLDNLVTCTPPRPEATDDPLERALEEIAVLASSMNEGKRESESRNKLVQWQSRIRGKFISPLVQPHRRLIMDGRLQLVRLVKKVNNRVDNPDGSAGQVEVPVLSSDSSPKQLVAILCNDLLVLCKEPAVAEPGSQVELWAVLRMQTMAQPASIVSGNGLRIVDNKAILYFNTQSTSEALTWQRAINLHIPHSQ